MSVSSAPVSRPAGGTTPRTAAYRWTAAARSGRLNHQLGWTLLATGFAWAAWLDPWSLSETDPVLLTGSRRMATRHAQAVVLGMGFLQLLVAHLRATTRLPPRAFQLSSWLVACGGVLYALGYGLIAQWTEGAWLIPLGALLNLAGFSLLAWIGPRQPGARELRLMLLVVAFGMLLDEVMALFVLSPDAFLPGYIGSEDGVRQRMLRLARAAAIALPVLMLLYRDLAIRRGLEQRLVRWGRAGLLVGMVGMPLILTAAAVTTVQLKYLLDVPAWAVLAGTLVGARLAWEHAGLLESWGWLLVATSMVAGMLMGAYAFDGPFQPPQFLGAYNDFARRLSRLGHAYAIVLGLTSIFVARRLARMPGPHRLERPGVLLLMMGTLTTVVAILALPAAYLPTWILSIGPAMVAAAVVLCIAPTARAARRAETVLSTRGTP
jgi:hypothetical protein